MSNVYIISRRRVTKEDGLRYMDDFKLNYFMEASAKTGINAKNVFVEAAKSLYNDFLKYKDKVDSVSIYNRRDLRVYIVILEVHQCH
jgi:hypothetical protein